MQSEHDRLAERIRNGDARALDDLFARHLPSLQAFIHLNMGAVLRAKESCEDLAQSTCRQLLQTMEAFEYAGEKAFRVYLYRAAMHKVLSRLRYYNAKKRDPGREIQLPKSAISPAVLDAYRSISSPSHHMIQAEEIGRIEAAFDELPPEDRELVSMKRLLGLSTREMAEKLDLDVHTVRRRLGRALARLASALGGTA